MSKHLKLYTTLNTYNFDNRYIPNVSFIEEDSEIKLEPNTSEPVEHNEYYYKYFTLEAVDDCNFSITISPNIAGNYSMIHSISYSTDNGASWESLNISNIYNTPRTIDFGGNISAGGKILLKGNNEKIILPWYTSGQYTYRPYIENTNSTLYTDGLVIQSSTGRFNISGNILSLFYEDQFINHNTFPVYQFSISEGTSSGYLYNTRSVPGGNLAGLFANNKKIYSAENLILPSICTPYCYSCMFYNSSLVIPPKLNSLKLSEGCYYGMFSRSNITSAPDLPATTLAKYCYNYMFYDCSSLTQPMTNLPALNVPMSSYSNMFNKCISLTTAPTLSALKMETDRNNNGNNCYNMFADCSSLITAPELPATELAPWCYSGMFKGCTSLIIGPSILPATKLASCCYGHSSYYGKYPLGGMFYGCTSLTTAPVLPATELVSGCYCSMFADCSSLNNIKMLGTSNITTDTCNYWVIGVAATGTFTKKAGAGWETIASSDNNYIGVPTGWDIETDPPTLMTMIVDKFPVNDPPVPNYWEDAGCETIPEYKQWSIDNDYGDSYSYYGDSIDYNGTTLYVWYANNGGDWHLFTTTDNYNTLYNESLEDDITNGFTSLYSVSTNDNPNCYLQEDFDSDSKKYLVKIINYSES